MTITTVRLLDDITFQPNCVYDVYVLIDGPLSGWTSVVDLDSSITPFGLSGIDETAFDGPSKAFLTVLYTGEEDTYYEADTPIAQVLTEQ